MVFPGNEAGDAASGASAAILDRGWGGSDNASTDNRSVVLVGAATTSGYTNWAILKHSANRDTAVSGALSPDNESSAATVTADVRNATTAPTVGTYSTALTTLASQNVDFAVEGTTQYLLTTFDNGTLWSRTSGDFSKYLDNVSGFSASTVILKSDGTDMIAVVDNGTSCASSCQTATVNRIDNSTASAEIARVSMLDNASSVGSSVCAAVGSGMVIVATDNATTGLDTTSNTVFYGGAYTGSSMPIIAGDNLTAMFMLDNSTAGTCDIAYGEVSGVFWYMVDNGSDGVHGLKTVDNGTNWTLVSEVIAGNADSISLTVDPVDTELVACVNDDGVLYAKKFVDNATWTDLGPMTSTAVVNGSTVDCSYNSDGTKIGMGYVSPGGDSNDSQVANFRIFYDDNQ